MAKRDWTNIVNFMAFVALMIIGLLLILNNVLDSSSDFVRLLADIARYLAYFTVAVCAFFYAHARMNKKQIWYMIAWVVAVVLIIVAYVL